MSELIDELERAIEAAKKGCWPEQPSIAEMVLAEHGERVLAAVRLAENAAAVEAFCRANESNPTKPGVAAEYERLSAERENALTAYRAAKEKA